MLFDLPGPQHVALQPGGRVPVGPPPQGDHPVLAHGHVQAAALLQADVEAGVLQLAVQLDAVLHDLALVCGPEHAEHAGAVLGGAVGDAVLVDDGDVAPSSLGQVVGHGVADQTGAGDHHLSLLGQPGLRRDLDDGTLPAVPVQPSAAMEGAGCWQDAGDPGGVSLRRHRPSGEAGAKRHGHGEKRRRQEEELASVVVAFGNLLAVADQHSHFGSREMLRKLSKRPPK